QPISSVFSASLKLDANVYLKLKASFGSANFPSISSDFVLTWQFDPTKDNKPPQVAFKNVTLDLGTFITNFAKPIINEVDKFIKPLRPVVDFLTAPIPVISQLSGNPKLSLLDLAIAFEGGDSSKVQPFENAFHLAEQIIDLVNMAPDKSTIKICLGSF